ncbi:MAG TPA: alpha/beta fold hydrolase [Candidatus Limnocylindrales bacterium]|jgi:pimeloyl-ACP methyl ester carboxylesterase
MTDGAGWVEVAGGRLPYQVAGSESGVVLAHAGIADMRQWDPQWDAVTAAHRVVRYDLRGFGGADVVDTRFSNRADMIAVMDAAGLDRAALVGCSRAGSIAIDTALEYPDRVSGLVWVCGGVSGNDGEDSPEEVAAGESEELLSEAKDWAGLADFDVELWVDGIGQPVGRAPAAARDAVRRMTFETYVQEKPYGDTIVLDPPAIGRLGEVRVPTLVMIGGLDTPSTRRSADLVAAGIPGARRIDLPDIAHMPSLERPEWFTETLLAFLATIG